MIGNRRASDMPWGADAPPASAHHEFGALVGVAEPMRRVFAVLERSARSDATVLLEGETGTGKEVAAASIHAVSARRLGPFVVADCGAIAAPLLESDLFGHEKGAFTGAIAQRVGAFEAASGGTIFLDEIAELPLELQPKLLRVLEQRKIRRVGSNTYRPVPVRVIAATNRDLLEEVRRGHFRQDLYYRLAVVRVRLPPLRERPEDLPILVEHILRSLGVGLEAATSFHAPDFIAKLQHVDWPGNVRELRNYLEQCVALGYRLPLGAGCENAAAQGPSAAPAAYSGNHEGSANAEPSFFDARKQAIDGWERQYLSALMEREGQSVESAARAACIGRSYLYRLLARHALLPSRRSLFEPSPRDVLLSASPASNDGMLHDEVLNS